ncbi:hypothetical protein ABTB07_23125, partial [Acinetobacter baumannii]
EGCTGARTEDARGTGGQGRPADAGGQVREPPGRAGAGATWDAVKAFRTLIAADVSLARNAAGRAAAFSAMAVIFGGTAW